MDPLGGTFPGTNMSTSLVLLPVVFSDLLFINLTAVWSVGHSEAAVMKYKELMTEVLGL